MGILWAPCAGTEAGLLNSMGVYIASIGNKEAVIQDVRAGNSIRATRYKIIIYHSIM